jgi:hypothetical protein
VLGVGGGGTGGGSIQPLVVDESQLIPDQINKLNSLRERTLAEVQEILSMENTLRGRGAKRFLAEAIFQAITPIPERESFSLAQLGAWGGQHGGDSRAFLNEHPLAQYTWEQAWIHGTHPLFPEYYDFDWRDPESNEDYIRRFYGIAVDDDVECGSVAADVVVGPGLDWGRAGTRITLGDGSMYAGWSGTRIWSQTFTATNNLEYRGRVSIAEVVGNESIPRRVWISSCPGGEAISPQCSGAGTGPVSVSWRQSDFRIPGVFCRLTPGSSYYLNVRNTSRCPENSVCAFYRSISTTDEPDTTVGVSDTDVCAESDSVVCGDDIDWSNPGSRTTVGVQGLNQTLVWRFTTGANPSDSGTVAIATNTTFPNTTRRVWISREPAGPPLAGTSRCDSTGSTRATIQWGLSSNPLRCSLATDTTYFLNITNVGGCEADQTCTFYREL